MRVVAGSVIRTHIESIPPATGEHAAGAPALAAEELAAVLVSSYEEQYHVRDAASHS
jgi:hypothetical protein